MQNPPLADIELPSVIPAQAGIPSRKRPFPWRAPDLEGREPIQFLGIGLKLVSHAVGPHKCQRLKVIGRDLLIVPNIGRCDGGREFSKCFRDSGVDGVSVCTAIKIERRVQ